MFEAVCRGLASLWSLVELSLKLLWWWLSLMWLCLSELALWLWSFLWEGLL